MKVLCVGMGSIQAYIEEYKSLKRGCFSYYNKIAIQALDNYCVIYLKFTTIFEITTRFNYIFKDRNV